MSHPEEVRRRFDERRGVLVVIALALGVWLWVTVPLATGHRTFYYRDVFNVHLPLKAFGAEQLREGRIPALEPGRGLGQPFRGNPQAAAFYPSNLLYGLLPVWNAFNLHIALHWLLAFAAMALLARALGLDGAGSVVAALAYAGGGWTLTALSFHHIIAVTAWWPLVLWGGVRGQQSGVAVGGFACGMALLAGAPEIVALGFVPLAGLAIGRHGLARGAGIAAAIAGLGALVALPQIVAFLRILPFTFRSVMGAEGAAAGLYALSPLRLLELALPLPFGRPGDLGLQGFWSDAAMPRVPLVLSLYFGAPALALAVAGIRRAKGWAMLAGMGLLGACFGEPILAFVSGGLFRYPEKLLFWPALALPLVAAYGIGGALANPERFRTACRVGAGFALALAMTMFVAGERLLAPWTSLAGAAPAQATLLGTSAFFLAVLLLACGAAVERPSKVALAFAQLLALLFLGPLVMTDHTAPYRQPSPWAENLPAGAALVPAAADDPFRSGAAYQPQDSAVTSRLRLGARDLDRVPGVLRGYQYPLAADFDGLAVPNHTPLLLYLPTLPMAERASWLRRLGVDAVIALGDPPARGLRGEGTELRPGLPATLYAVEDPAPFLWWPQRVVAAQAADAFVHASRTLDPTATVTASEPIEQGNGTVREVSAEPDRIVFEVESDGGLVVVQRAYQPLYRARLVQEQSSGAPESADLRTLPVDLLLLGVDVPPGTHRVEVSISSDPEKAAAAGSFAILLGIVALAWPRRKTAQDER
ncbi:MAG: hypothetical protein AAF481_05060 [Acidobacteriota bacterium]